MDGFETTENDGFVLLPAANGGGALVRKSQIAGARANGRDRDRTDLREWAKQKDLDFHIVHSSGHASSADLYRMAQAVAPQRLLPIHTVYPERYDSLSANTEIVANGEWVTI